MLRTRFADVFIAPEKMQILVLRDRHTEIRMSIFLRVIRALLGLSHENIMEKSRKIMEIIKNPDDSLAVVILTTYNVLYP